MTHDLLNQLQIAFTFAQACAECVTQLMYAEARKNERIPILNQSYPPFTLIVIINDSGNGTIHTMRTEHVSKTILPNESAVAIYDILTKSIFLLPQILILKFAANILEHWDHPDAFAGFWCGNVEFHLAVIL